jgi:glycerol-3-phosphate acyltransferase PlsY
MIEIFFKLTLIVVVSYLIGSFPSAVVISKKFFGFDIREKGSGNMGSTNAFRVLGWKWGIVVQILDILKGIAAVAVATYIGNGINLGHHTWFEDITLIKMLGGAAAVTGHIWSLFVKFRGGKGINTAAGMLIAIAPIDVGIAVGIFIIAVIFSGYISLGSISAAFAFPSSMFVRYNILHVDIPGYQIMIYFSIAVSLILIYAHRSNIKRLLLGAENRFEKLQLIKCKSHHKKSI